MKVRVRIENTRVSGNRKGWTKHVTAVDTSKDNGYAFEGDFVNDGEHDLEVGAVLVSKDPAGSVKHGYHVGCCGVVQTDGGIKWVTDREYKWREDFLSFRDLVAKHLNQEINPLADVSDEALIAEVKRRGISVS